MGLEVHGGQGGQGFLGAGLDLWAIMGQCLTSAMVLRVMGPEHNMGLPLESPESTSGLRESAWWTSAGCGLPRPAPLLPEGWSSGNPGRSLRSAGLPGRSFGSLNTPSGPAPGISEASRVSGQRLRNTGVLAVVEGATATCRIQGEWGYPLCCVEWPCPARDPFVGAAPGAK